MCSQAPRTRSSNVGGRILVALTLTPGFWRRSTSTLGFLVVFNVGSWKRQCSLRSLPGFLVTLDVGSWIMAVFNLAHSFFVAHDLGSRIVAAVAG